MKKISVYLLAIFIKIKYGFFRSVKEIANPILYSYKDKEMQDYYNLSTMKNMWNQAIHFDKTKESVISMIIDWYAEG